MSNTIIQIKRSQTTATPTTLAEGELAYSGNGVSNSLFIGLPDGANTVTRIAGGKYGFLHNANTGNSTVAVIEGGKLTANAVLVTDANSSIDELRTAKLIINTSGNTVNEITSVSISANSTQLGANAGGSNTELVTSSAIKTYIDGKTAAIGGALANQQVAFSNGSVFQGSNALTFDFGSNTLNVSNTVIVGTTTTINSSVVSATNIVSNTANVASKIDVGANVAVNTSSVFVGNSTVNTLITSSSISTTGTLTVTNNATFSNGITMSNTVISNVADPVNPKDVANKFYVDSVAEGLHVHPSVVAATPNTLAVISGSTVTYDNGTSGVGATLTLGAPITAIDNVTLSANNRVLVKNEANQAHNGIYLYSNSTVLTRSDDFDSALEIAGGDFLFVTSGNTYNSTGWVQIDEVTTVGTDLVIFEQFSGAGVFTAGDYLYLDGSEFNVNATSNSTASVVVARDSSQNFSANVVTVNSIAAGNGQFSGPVTGITTLAAGNTTITGFANITSTLAAGNTVVTGTLAANDTTITGTANISSTLAAGNTTITGFVNVTSSGTIGGLFSVTDTTESSNTTSGSATIAGGLGVAKKINAAEVAVGNTSTYTSINAVAVSTANVFATGTVNGSILSVGGWVIANNSGIFTSGVANADILSVGTFFKANTTAVTASVPLTVTNTAGLGNTTITGFANITSTLAAGDTTITGFANISGDLTVSGNSAIGSDSSDRITVNALLNSNVIPAANLAYVLGNSDNRFAQVFTGNVVATNGSFVDLTVTGNLVVEGTLTTIDTDNLVVEDPLIKLARNNSTDAVDIGLFGQYANTPTLFSGLFRDASDNGIWKFFKELEAAPTTTVDTANNTFTIATVEAYLKSGGLLTNSTSLSITANSTYSVNVTANSISANVVTVTGSANNDIFFANGSGALVARSLGADGTVLQSNGTAVIYAGLDGGTF